MDDSPILLFEDGLTCTKIHTDNYVSAEEYLVGGIPVDRSGNHYSIGPEIGDYHLARASVITRQTESGIESIFAVLDPPDGYEAEFDALGFDRSGNMIVAVLLQKKRAYWGWEVRDYYRVEGMPKPSLAESLFPAISLVALCLFPLLFFVYIMTFRRTEPRGTV